MIVLGWIGVLLVGFGTAVYASTRTVRHAEALAHGTRIPPFFIGLTLLAVGTDLPEIANSVISCFAGHGDLNAGDSVGSALTQATLVLGLLPIIAGRMHVERANVAVLGTACVVALALGAFLMNDAFLARTDGLALVGAWIVGSAIVWRQLSPSGPVEPVRVGGRLANALAALLYLGLVATGAGAAVAAFVRLSPLLGVPEYVLSFFVSALGTSLPELFVGLTALRAGLKDLALGDVLGSSFFDSTLSIGIGPLLFPAAVTPELAVEGSVVAIVGIGLMTVLLSLRKDHTWLSGTALIALYIAVYVVLLR